MDHTPVADSVREHHRILVIDDSPSIHEDFREILTSGHDGGLDEMDDLFFDTPDQSPAPIAFEIDSAFQGQEGLHKVQQAVNDRQPYAVCFLDVRMPPGWNGPETLAHLWQVAPDLQVVLCTAYSDFSWQELVSRFDRTDRLLILKKPFEVAEVRQLAHALTEKWRLARQNARRMDELERRVAERTQELEAANSQLRSEMRQRIQAQRELNRQQRLEALGRLAAGVGHEINNPLGFIAGNIEMTRELIDAQSGTIPDEPRREMFQCLDHALVGADRIAHIVRSINRFIRPIDEVEKPVSVPAAIEQVIAMVEHDRDDHIELAADLEHVPLVLGRQHELEQVLINLIRNAFHALSDRPPGDARVAVATRYEAHGDAGHVVVAVTDTGTGIREADIDKIFDPFYTTKSVGQGTGLGLSVCHAIISAMGGTIDARPGDPVGTVMTLRLPALTAADPTGAESTAPDAVAAAPGDAADQRRARVLVVEDEPLLCKVIQHVLRDHDVTIANDGREALARCTSDDFDVILCDLMLPELNGIELYRALEQSRPHLARKIVFITAGSVLDEVQAFLSEVPNQCLEKPIPIKRLRTCIADSLSRRP